MMFSYLNIFTTDHIALMPNGLKVLGHIILPKHVVVVIYNIYIIYISDKY